MTRHACLFGAVLIQLVPLLAIRSANGEEPKGGQEGSSGKTYTAYNLWYEKPEKVPSINYKAGVMIPAGTEVASAEIGSRRGRYFIELTTAAGHGRYKILFEKKFHPGMTVDDFKERLVTGKTLAELTEGMTEKEIKAIKAGKLVVGMSKEAVVISRGYPPEHRTPSLEVNLWTYWQNRFRTKAVHFDDTGRTKRPEVSEDDL